MDGTFRPERHGSRQAVQAQVMAGGSGSPSRSPSLLPDGVLDGLGDAGRAFLTTMLDRYQVSFIQLTLLKEAAQCVDALAIWRPLATTDKGAARLVVGLTKTLASLLAQAQMRG